MIAWLVKNSFLGAFSSFDRGPCNTSVRCAYIYSDGVQTGGGTDRGWLKHICAHMSAARAHVTPHPLSASLDSVISDVCANRHTC